MLLPFGVNEYIGPSLYTTKPNLINAPTSYCLFCIGKEILFLIPYKRSNWFGVSLSFNIFWNSSNIILNIFF